MFKYKNGYFTNFHSKKVITVSGGTDKEAQPIWVWKRYAGRNPA
jgi:hypothetical protein